VIKDANINQIKAVLLGGSYKGKEYLAHDAFTLRENYSRENFVKAARELADDFPYIREVELCLSLSSSNDCAPGEEVFRFPRLTEDELNFLFDAFCRNEAEELFELLGFRNTLSAPGMLVVFADGPTVSLRKHDNLVVGAVTSPDIKEPLNVEGANWLDAALMEAGCCEYFKAVAKKV
jgi:hypothetical protein